MRQANTEKDVFGKPHLLERGELKGAGHLGGGTAVSGEGTGQAGCALMGDGASACVVTLPRVERALAEEG